MTDEASGSGRSRLALAAALLVLGAAGFWNLGQPHLWGDEAGTALFARNLLATGRPVAFDGRNLSIFDGGTELNRELLVLKLPWVQYGLGALSIALFGDTARGVRTLFALTGVLTLLPLWALLRRRLPCALPLSVLILVSPQVLLFHRNARYFPVLTLVFAVLAWLVCDGPRSRARGLGLGTLCFVVMFHTHPVAAATCGAATLLFHLLWQRNRLLDAGAACGLGFLSWWLWYLALGPLLVEPPPLLDALTRDFGAWLTLFGTGLVAAVMDLDFINAVPILTWVLALAAALVLAPGALRDAAREPLNRFIAVCLAVHVVAVAAVMRTEARDSFTILRYMPHLIAFAVIPLFSLLSGLARDRRVGLLLCAAALATNLLTLSFWSPTPGRAKAPSWWPPVAAGIAAPRPEAWDAVEAVIRSHAPSPPDDEQTLLVIPPWMKELAIGALGDRFIVVPSLEPGSPSEPHVRGLLGDAVMDGFLRKPAWVVIFHGQARVDAPGYERIEVPVHRRRPDDGTRPELTRHTFRQAEPVGMAYVYRLVE